MGFFQRVCVLLVTGAMLQGCSARGDNSSSHSTPATPVLSSIQIESSTSQVAVGTTKKFSATAIYLDGTKADITSTVSWSSSDAHIATVGNTLADSGIAKALNPGLVQIKASLSDISAISSLTVSSATLSKLNISAVIPKFVAGTDQQLSATALFSDGTSQNVTDSATWGSSDSAIITVQDDAGSKGHAKGIAQGQTSILASFMGTPASIGLSVSTATIQKISLVPTSTSFPKGTTASVRAIGVFSDNSTQDITEFATWSSSSAAIFSAAGLSSSGQIVLGVGSGSSQLSAAYLGATGTVSLTVTAATLDSIQIESNDAIVAKGLSRHLRSVGIFSDGSKQDLTLMSVWSSSAKTIAVVENSVSLAGIVTGVSPGSSTISAKAMDKSASSTFAVTGVAPDQISLWPASLKLVPGLAAPVSSTMLFSDNTSQDVTADSFWTIGDTTIAQSSLNSHQMEAVTGLIAGTSTVSAAFQGISASSPLTVTAATPTTLSITPSNPSIATGTSVQLKASVVFSDGNSQDVTSFVTWSASSTAVVTISNATSSKGLVRGLASGSSSITANYLGLTATSAVVDSGATVASIAITPANPTLAKNTSRQFSAMATLSDGSLQDITRDATWGIAAESLARIGNLQRSSGRVDTLAQGNTNITARYSGVAGSTALTVTAATLQTLSISPTASSVAKNATQQFVATAKFSDGSSQDVAGAATWKSSDAAVAAISNAEGLRGLAQGLAAGSATINAYYGGGSASSTLNVLPASITSIDVTPASPSVHVGATQQFTATVHYSDGTFDDVSALVSWGSSSASVATISNVSGSAGLAQAKAVGTSTISAIYSGHAGSTNMAVTAAGP